MANEQAQLERTRASAAPPAERVSTTPSQRELAFKTFGVLDAGEQSKSSVVTSLVINGLILLIVIAVSLTAKKIVKTATLTTLTAPIPIKKEAPPKPPPPPKLPKPPIVKVTPPNIPDIPKIEVPEPPKIQPVIMKASPVPVITPPAPKAVTPPPAPRPVAIQLAQAASVPNNDAHPSPVRLGSMTNPINNTSGPAVSPVNLGRSGAPGMPAGNSGMGAPSKIAIGGSGSPNGQMGGHDNAVQPIRGISTGVTGGTGPLSARPVGAIAIAKATPPPSIQQPQASVAPAKTSPKVLFKPKPTYTEEARKLHLEGNVSVKIHVSAAGAVSVVGVQSGLGHGLDEAAVHAVQSMRFQPAMANGQPTDWEGVVSVSFQLAD
ncbi:energy transducer TonB [Terriglobus roseus]|uniref:TonB family C-terminal domain-containing protein n=1 Tax=Terriglobus roseus TaxID=392734 RepID=A0A1H4RE68_9BACT|nr:energy transducer TonB [Terriglobus roseus]SEC30098.1 TonB family C-terminal domain-containing protein [Terriglobus roseus]